MTILSPPLFRENKSADRGFQVSKLFTFVDPYRFGRGAGVGFTG